VEFSFVSDLGHDSLKEPIEHNFGNLDQDLQARQIHDLNVGLVSLGGADEELNAAFAEAEALGYRPFRWQNVVIAVVDAIKAEGIELPSGKKAARERGKRVDDLLARFAFHADSDDAVKIIFTDANGENEAEVIQRETLSDLDVASAVNAISDDPAVKNLVFGRIIQRVGAHARTQKGLVFGEARAGQIDSGSDPHLLVESSSAPNQRLSTRHDDVIAAESPQSVRTAIEYGVRRHAAMRERSKALRVMAEDGQITVLPAFTFDSWPTDAMMTRLRDEVGPITNQYMRDEDILCDDRDLKYQTLFRLTTHDVAEIFENGKELQDHLLATGAFRNWRNILRVGREQTDDLVLNQDLVREAAAEQAKIIQARLKQSALPLESILTPAGMFAEQGWFIQKKNGTVQAIREGGISYADGIVNLEFREVDTELAEQFHGDLHYIHTPRAEKAFGMFVEGEELPFSVLSLQKVDRNYKKNALLYQGYDPERCYDLTRLYSRPGTPGNASSTMFTLTFNYLRSETDTQAVLSAFMPSYATGISMTSSKMDRPVLVKPLQHRFGPAGEHDGQVLYENMTKRRLGGVGLENVIYSKVPLLPVVELMCPIQDPRFTPVPGAKSHMFETLS
jgi:hypothetical protein